MASNFELGDEQPENPPPRRKPFKPSGKFIAAKITIKDDERQEIITEKKKVGVNVVGKR